MISLVKILACATTVGCMFSSCLPKAEHIKQTKRVMTLFTKKMQEECHFIPLGGGGFYKNKKVDSFYADFAVKKNDISQEEAKKTVLLVAQVLIEEVNNKKEIHPFLINYPICLKDVSVSISFLSPSTQYHCPSQIVLDRETISYFHYNPHTKNHQSYKSEVENDYH